MHGQGKKQKKRKKRAFSSFLFSTKVQICCGKSSEHSNHQGIRDIRPLLFSAKYETRHRVTSTTHIHRFSLHNKGWQRNGMMEFSSTLSSTCFAVGSGSVLHHCHIRSKLANSGKNKFGDEPNQHHHSEIQNPLGRTDLDCTETGSCQTHLKCTASKQTPII